MNTKKQFVIDACKTSEFIIPKITLSKYIKMIENKEIDPSVKPFDLCYRFYNLSFHNHSKELREKINDLSDMWYLETIDS